MFRLEMCLFLLLFVSMPFWLVLWVCLFGFVCRCPDFDFVVQQLAKKLNGDALPLLLTLMRFSANQDLVPYTISVHASDVDCDAKSRFNDQERRHASTISPISANCRRHSKVALHTHRSNSEDDPLTESEHLEGGSQRQNSLRSIKFTIWRRARVSHLADQSPIASVCDSVSLFEVFFPATKSRLPIWK